MGRQQFTRTFSLPLMGGDDSLTDMQRIVVLMRPTAREIGARASIEAITHVRGLHMAQLQARATGCRMPLTLMSCVVHRVVCDDATDDQQQIIVAVFCPADAPLG